MARVAQDIVASRVTGAMTIHLLAGQNKGNTTLCLSGGLKAYRLEPDSDQASSAHLGADSTSAEEQL